GRAVGDDNVFGNFRRARIARLVEAERVPTFIIVLDELRKFIAQTRRPSPSGVNAVFQRGLGVAGVGVALIAGRLRIGDGLGGGFARGRLAGDGVIVGHFAGCVGCVVCLRWVG